MSNQMWIDEAVIYHSYREPTPAEIMERFHYWDGKNWRDPWTGNRYMMGIEAASREQADKERQRRLFKERRRIEMERCLHGLVPFEIHWQPGTHPSGERTYFVNIEGMAGGPYYLNEADHQILHNVRRNHDHVATLVERTTRGRSPKDKALSASPDEMSSWGRDHSPHESLHIPMVEGKRDSSPGL